MTKDSDKLYSRSHASSYSSIISVLIFGIRMNNWQSRQRANQSDPTLAGSVMGLHFILHAVMIACHTFVLLFFCFIFMVCAYWFVFFKLQNEVFLLLPPENEFYG